MNKWVWDVAQSALSKTNNTNVDIWVYVKPTSIFNHLCPTVLTTSRPFPKSLCQRGAQFEMAESLSAGLQQVVGSEAVHDSTSSSHTFIIVALKASRAPLQLY